MLFFGVLYHLRYPLLAIDNLRKVCRGTVLVETHALDDGWLGRREAGAPFLPLRQVHADLPQTALWRYYHNGELMGDRTNCFGPTCRAVEEAFQSAGFECRLLCRWGDRASFEAVARVGLNEALQGAYEMQARANREALQLDQPAPPPCDQPPRAEVRQPFGPAATPAGWRGVWRRLLGRNPARRAA